MPVTEIKISKRPDTNKVFYPNSGLPEVTAVKSFLVPFLANGALTTTEVLSDNDLTLTRTQVFSNLETYSAIDTKFSVSMDAEYKKYYGLGINSENFDPYTQSGISQPFTCTTVYTFPIEATEMRDFVVDAINNDGKGKVKDLQITDTSISVVHEYANSADFTLNRFNDLNYVDDLNEAGFTRTITYALV